MTIEEILRKAVSEGASDILIIAGMPAGFKINGLIQRQGEPLLPDAERSAAYEPYYRLYESLYPALKPACGRLAAL